MNSLLLVNHEPMETLRMTAEKLIFYVSFTVRSRTQATAMSMRSMSMFMMLCMMITVSVTKQQQARRYAEIYGVDPYGRNPYGNYGASPFGGLFLTPHRMYEQEVFWDQFESGRSGRAMQIEQREDAFFRLQILHMLLRQRQIEEDGDEDGEEEYEDFGEDGEEMELLSAQASFYEEERRCAEQEGNPSRYH